MSVDTIAFFRHRFGECRSAWRGPMRPCSFGAAICEFWRPCVLPSFFTSASVAAVRRQLAQHLQVALPQQLSARGQARASPQMPIDTFLTTSPSMRGSASIWIDLRGFGQ
jgi:hypothetical protein